MQWALVDTNGIVKNLIAYDGVSLFTPPMGLGLQQINDWVQIGQPINIPQPSSPPVSIPIPDLATQLASALIANGTLQPTDINSTTLATVNSTLAASGQSTISLIAQKLS